MKKVVKYSLKKKIIVLLTILLCFTLSSLKLVIAQQNKPVLFEQNPEKIVIADKLGIVYHQDLSSKNTILRIFINGGLRAVPIKKRGLAFMTTRLNIDIPETSIVKKLMTMGSTASVNVDRDHSVITVKSLSEHLDKTLKIFTDNIKNPLFSGLRITNIKRNLKHYQKSENDNPEQLMSLTFFNSLYRNTGYEGSKFGDTESIKNIKKKDITDFYKQYFNLANIVISVSSDLGKSKIVELIEKYFSSFPRGDQKAEFPPISISQKLESKEKSIKKEVTQTLISLGALLPEISPQNYTCAIMLKSLLSDGIGSKLWSLRETQDLAYYFAAKVTYNKDAGLLTVFLKTKHDKKAKAFEELKKILSQLYTKGVTEEEFSNSKVQCRTNFLRSIETKEFRTLNLGYYEMIGLGYDFFQKFFDHLENISLEQFNSFLKILLKPDHMVQIVIGPEEE
jgi:predicted Zn-dependent peptidase